MIAAWVLVPVAVGSLLAGVVLVCILVASRRGDDHMRQIRHNEFWMQEAEHQAIKIITDAAGIVTGDGSIDEIDVPKLQRLISDALVYAAGSQP